MADFRRKLRRNTANSGQNFLLTTGEYGDQIETRLIFSILVIQYSELQNFGLALKLLPPLDWVLCEG
jgi:hypothetical protein